MQNHIEFRGLKNSPQSINANYVAYGDKLARLVDGILNF